MDWYTSALAVTCSLRLPLCQELHFPNLDKPGFDAQVLWSDPCTFSTIRPNHCRAILRLLHRDLRQAIVGALILRPSSRAVGVNINEIIVEESSQVGLDSESGGSSSSALAFITFSNPKEVKASSNRYLVRSHALRDFHTKKRRQGVLQNVKLSHQQRYSNIAAKSDKLPGLHHGQCSCGDTHHIRCGLSHQWHQCPTQSNREALTPALVGLLGAGRIDPFSTYPRPVSYLERLLVDYCKL